MNQFAILSHVGGADNLVLRFPALPESCLGLGPSLATRSNSFVRFQVGTRWNSMAACIIMYLGTSGQSCWEEVFQALWLI